jgi:hypothetical protein
VSDNRSRWLSIFNLTVTTVITMEKVIYKPRTYRNRTFLPGRGQNMTHSSLPGVDTTERTARRTVWMRNQSARRAQHEWGGKVGFASALAALLIAVALSFATSSNALERAALAQQMDALEAPTVQVDTDVIRPAADANASAPAPIVRS